MNEIKEETYDNIITGYYHGLYYYLVLIDPFNCTPALILEYVRKYNRRVKVIAPKPILDSSEFKQYMLNNYGEINYFINPVHYTVYIYTTLPINTIQIFKATGYYCIQRKPVISSVSASVEHIYRQNFEQIYNLKSNLYKGTTMSLAKYILFSPLGGGSEIGRSCSLLRTDQTSIIIDVGLGFKKNAYEPIFDEYVEGREHRINAVFLTHPHLDHVGKIITLLKRGYKGPIYITKSGLKLTYLTLLDCLKLFTQNNKTPEYSTTDVERFVKQCVVINYGQKLHVAADLSVTPKHSCHILGSYMLEISINHKVYLFTSDFNENSPGVELLKPFKIHNVYQRIISEGTNLSKESNFNELDCAIDLYLKETKENMGNILMPCLLYGRGQEILYNLIKCMSKNRQLLLPIYITKSVSEITKIYFEHTEELSKIGRQFITSGIIDKFTTVITKENKDIVLESSSVIVAPSGMLEGGVSIKWLLNIIEDSRSICLLSCYQPPGTLGHALKQSIENQMITIEYNGIEYKSMVKCKISTISPFFGAHITKSGLLKMLKKHSRDAPILIHLELTDSNKTVIKTQKFVVPNNLETIRLL